MISKVYGGEGWSFEPAEKTTSRQPKLSSKSKLDGRLSLQIENRPGGKKVTIIKGFLAGDSRLEKIAHDLKTKCGTGGTVKAATIEIQGDHRDTIRTHLQILEFKVKN